VSRERGNNRICNNHLRGELNVEDRPDSVCGALSLVLGPKAKFVGACAHSGEYEGVGNKRRVRIERKSYKQIELNSRASGRSTIRASAVRLNSWVKGGKIRRTVNLYRPNERNDVSW